MFRERRSYRPSWREGAAAGLSISVGGALAHLFGVASTSLCTLIGGLLALIMVPLVRYLWRQPV